MVWIVKKVEPFVNMQKRWAVAQLNRHPTRTLALPAPVHTIYALDKCNSVTCFAPLRCLGGLEQSRLRPYVSS